MLRQPRESHDRLRAAYHRFSRSLARAGVTRLPHEPALSFARRAMTQLPDDSGPILALSQRYVMRRYAQNDDDVESDAALARDLQRFRVNRQRSGSA
jgi:hypothetical protein